MKKCKTILDFLDADLEEAKDIVYPELIPYYSKDGIKNYNPVHHGLFDDTPEQTSHGTAPWDDFGWSRDGWVI